MSSNQEGPVRVLALLTLALSFCASEVAAQRMTFDPSVFFSYFRAENLDLTGDSGETDYGYRFGIELPVERELRKGTLSLTYQPQLEQFEDFEELDNDSHDLRLDLDLQPTRSSRFGLNLGYSKTIEQGDPARSEDPDLFLAGRADRDLGRIGLTYQNRFSGRWGWRGVLGYSKADYKEIPGFAPAAGTAAQEDRTSTRSALGIFRTLSQRTSIGGTFEYRAFDLDMSGKEESRLVGLTVNSELSPGSTLEVTVGVFRSTGVAARGGRSDLEQSREGSQGRLIFRRILRKVDFDVFASVEPTSGGAREGTSTNSTVGVSLAGRERRFFSWSWSTRYARRVSSDPDRPEIESFAVSLTTEFQIARNLGLRLGARYIDQTGQGDDISLFSEGGLSMVWYPLAGSRISGRPSRTGQ